MFVCLFVPFAPSFLRILKLKIVVVADHDIHLAGNDLVPNPAAYNTEMIMHECRGSKRQAYFLIRMLLRGSPVAAAFLPVVPFFAGRPCICRSHALEKSQYYVPGEMGLLMEMNNSARIHSVTSVPRYRRHSSMSLQRHVMRRSSLGITRPLLHKVCHVAAA